VVHHRHHTYKREDREERRGGKEGGVRMKEGKNEARGQEKGM
jgi:hypothetical protein